MDTFHQNLLRLNQRLLLLGADSTQLYFDPRIDPIDPRYFSGIQTFKSREGFKYKSNTSAAPPKVARTESENSELLQTIKGPGNQQAEILPPFDPWILVSRVQVQQTSTIIFPNGSQIIRYPNDTYSPLYQCTLRDVKLTDSSVELLHRELLKFGISMDAYTIETEFVVLEQPPDLMSNVFYHGWLWPNFFGFEEGVNYTTHVLVGYFNPVGVYQAEPNGDVDVNKVNKILEKDVLEEGKLKPMENHLHPVDNSIEFGADTALIRYADQTEFKTMVLVGVDTRTHRILVSRVMMMPPDKIPSVRKLIQASPEKFVKDMIYNFLKSTHKKEVGDFYELDKNKAVQFEPDEKKAYRETRVKSEPRPSPESDEMSDEDFVAHLASLSGSDPIWIHAGAAEAEE